MVADALPQPCTVNPEPLSTMGGRAVVDGFYCVVVHPLSKTHDGGHQSSAKFFLTLLDDWSNLIPLK
jgi:hypothetical protein